MEHEITVHLSDDEYAALVANAHKNGVEIEDVIHHMLAGEFHELIHDRSFSFTSDTLSDREIAKYLYHTGLISHIPSGERLSDEDEAELKRLADFFGQGGGKLASEMVIEDRGPY